MAPIFGALRDAFLSPALPYFSLSARISLMWISPQFFGAVFACVFAALVLVFSRLSQLALSSDQDTSIPQGRMLACVR